VLRDAKYVVQVAAARPIQLVTASGDQLPILEHVRASVQLDELNVLHEFGVVKTLVAPVILGIDILQGNGLTLDFTQNPVTVSNRSPKVSSLTDNSMAITQVDPIYEATPKRLFQACAISVNHEPEVDIVDNSAVPNYNSPLTSELPTCSSTNLHFVIEKYHKLLYTKPGYTEDAWHYIPTVGNPVNVPPRCIPAHYNAEAYQQIQTMLDEGIIKHSKNPWMALAVFVPKKTRQLQICIDYRELNKCTAKDSYPLPLPDEVQACRINSIFYTGSP